MIITTKRPDVGFHLHGFEEQPLDRLVDDPDAGDQQQQGLEQRREVLDLAVAVGVLAVGGPAETRTAKSVTTAATRSRPEWAASERMPRLPVITPTTSLNSVRKMAAITELSAAPFFSRSAVWLFAAGPGSLLLPLIRLIFQLAGPFAGRRAQIWAMR